MSISPAGNDPELSDQVYGVVPPLAATDVKYALLTCPPGREVVVI